MPISHITISSRIQYYYCAKDLLPVSVISAQ